MSEDTKYQGQYIEEDEISLKEIIEKIQEYSREVLRNWKILLLVCVLFVGFKVYQAITDTPEYTADLTFMVNEDEGGGMGGIGSILGQFGLARGGSAKFNLDKILELAKSRKMIQSLLFEMGIINNVNDFYANHLIDEFKFREDWADDEKTKYLVDFKFTHDSIPVFEESEFLVFKKLYNKIKGSEEVAGILQTSYQEETGIMNLKITTTSEQLSIQLCRVMYEKLSNYYVAKSIEKQLTTYNIIKSKVDSLKAAVAVAENRWAGFKDSNRGLWTASASLRELQLKRDIEVLNLMYGESLKNLEIADFSLRSETPFVQLIDAPIPPLSPAKESLLKALIIGIILGGLLSTTYIVGRKIYRDTMSS